MTNLYFVRHAESVGNVNKLIYSQKRDCDVELSENGIKQSESIISELRCLTMLDFRWHGLWYSPYIRAIQTKDIMKTGLEKGDCFAFEKMNVILREREWGDLQELSNKNALSDYFFNFYHRPKDGESFADVYQRVMTFHQYILSIEHSVYAINDHVIISHGEFLKVYMMFLLNWTIEEFDKFKTPRNAQVYHLYTYDNSVWYLNEKTPLIERNK